MPPESLAPPSPCACQTIGKLVVQAAHRNLQVAVQWLARPPGRRLHALGRLPTCNECGLSPTKVYAWYRPGLQSQPCRNVPSL